MRAAAERPKANTERLPEYSNAALPGVQARLLAAQPIYPEFEKVKLAWSLAKMRERLGTDNPLVQQILGKESPEHMAARLIDGGKLNDPTVRKALCGTAARKRSTEERRSVHQAGAGDRSPSARAIRKQLEDEVGFWWCRKIRS